MRVAVVVRSLKIGGMERVAVNLSEAFAKEGHESHLIYFKAKGKKLSPNDSVVLHHFNLESSLKKSGIGALLLIFAKLINGIFRGSFFFLNALFLTPIFKYKLKKIEKEYGNFDLIVIRGHGTFEMIWPFRDDRVIQMVESIFIRNKTLMDKLYIQCVYNKKHLRGVSVEVKEEILRVTKKFKVVPASIGVIYNPIDAEKILKDCKEYEVSLKQDYILSVGRVTPNKNIPFLLRSYKIAKDKYKMNLPLVIIGDGHDMPTVKKEINRLSLVDDVLLLGLKTNPYPWMQKAKVLTSTSKAEGFGMVIVEALITSTPVLATASKGGVKDIMKDELSNYMIAFDEEKFAKKMSEIVYSQPTIDYTKFFKPFLSAEVVLAYLEFVKQRKAH